MTDTSPAELDAIARPRFCRRTGLGGDPAEGSRRRARGDRRRTERECRELVATAMEGKPACSRRG